MKKRSSPDFSECMAMMRKHNPQTKEDGFHLLRPRASEFVEDLLREFRTETRDHGLRAWLLELIGEASDNRALEVLAQQLDSDDQSLRTWAIYGLKKLNTAEARAILFNAGLSDLSQPLASQKRADRRSAP